MMFESIFIISTAIYAIIAIKVEQWIVISALGFRLATPEYFLRNPQAYKLVRFILFLVALVAMFLAHTFLWYIGLFALLIIWLGAGWIGLKKAIQDYRRILCEMIEDAESEEEKQRYVETLNITDQELMDRVRVSKKYRI